VSFVAEDSFLPRPLTVRGHRLVFSNGIIVLAVASIVLLVATRARVAALIPMYAIGVFTGFTMAGAGMTKHHLTHREPGWRRSAAVSGTAAAVCLLVVVIFAVTEFTRGAWVVVLVMPIIIYGLMKTNAQYREEDSVLDEGVALRACEAPVLRRHTAIVLVDRIDLATARAIQYARNLTPDELYAVHFNIDNQRAEAVMRRWRDLGLSRLPLEVVEVADRRLGRAALELAGKAAGDGQTEVSVLIPTRTYRRSWGVLLHGKNADRLVRVLGHIPHVNATLVPFNVADLAESQRILATPEVLLEGGDRPQPSAKAAGPPFTQVAGTTPIPELAHRQPAKVAGRIRSVRIQPWSGAPAVECTLTDATGAELLVVFLGRREVAGVRTGTQIVVEGVVGDRRGRLAMLNPQYELLAVPNDAPDSTA
jgi:hypothetical protein